MSIIIKGITKAQFYKDANKIPYMDVGRDIEELPPHGRLIDADALEEEPCDLIDDRGLEAESGYSHDQIRNAPTIIEAEVKEEAKSNAWLKRKSMIYCSECCESFDAMFVNDFNYCPNCGADMRGEKSNGET